MIICHLTISMALEKKQLMALFFVVEEYNACINGSFAEPCVVLPLEVPFP